MTTRMGLFTGVLTQLVDSYGPAFWAVLGTAWQNFSTLAAAALQNLIDVVQLVIQLLNGDWAGAWEAGQGIVERTLAAIQTALGNLAGLAQTAWSALVGAVPGLYEEVKSAFEGTDWATVGSSLMQAVIDAAEAAWAALVAGVSWFQQTFGLGMGGLDWGAIGTALMDIVKVAAEAVWAIFVGASETLRDDLSDRFGELDWGAIGTALMDALVLAAGVVWDLLVKSASAMWQLLKDAFAAATGPPSARRSWTRLSLPPASSGTCW